MKPLHAAIAIIFVTSPVFPGVSSACEGELQIANIEPGSAQAKIFKLLGEPKAIRRHEGFVERTLIYNGLQIGLDEDMLVAYIKSTSEIYCLTGNICPGMSLSEIEDLPLKFDRKKIDGNIVMTLYEDSCWGSAKLNNAAVESVEINCQP
jgi:hypothetical protein